MPMSEATLKAVVKDLLTQDITVTSVDPVTGDVTTEEQTIEPSAEVLSAFSAIIPHIVQNAQAKVTVPSGMFSQGSAPGVTPNAAPIPLTGSPGTPPLLGGLT